MPLFKEVVPRSIGAGGAGRLYQDRVVVSVYATHRAGLKDPALYDQSPLKRAGVDFTEFVEIIGYRRPLGAEPPSETTEPPAGLNSRLQPGSDVSPGD